MESRTECVCNDRWKWNEHEKLWIFLNLYNPRWNCDAKAFQSIHSSLFDDIIKSFECHRITLIVSSLHLMTRFSFTALFCVHFFCHSSLFIASSESTEYCSKNLFAKKSVQFIVNNAVALAVAWRCITNIDRCTLFSHRRTHSNGWFGLNIK